MSIADNVRKSLKSISRGVMYLIFAYGGLEYVVNNIFKNDLVHAQSPNNTEIAFTSHRDRDSGIYVMNADGSNPTNLTRRSVIGFPTNGAWSPDGRMIAFALSSGDGSSDIYVMNADGSNPTNLTKRRKPDYDWGPAWSPDGRMIAFASNRDGNPEIYVMDADGSNPRNLEMLIDGKWGLVRVPTRTSYGDRDPVSWSPDGRMIVFTDYNYSGTGTCEIYVMNAGGGSKPTRLTHNITYDGDPAWSPDGRRIAFTSKRDGNAEIYVMNADGSNPTRLTHNITYDGDPAWSPDGRRIAFTSYRDGNTEIYVMNADGSNPTNLTRHPDSDINPTWSPFAATSTSVKPSTNKLASIWAQQK